MQRKGDKHRSKGKNNKQPKELAASVMVYNGPIISKADAQSYDLHTQVLVQDVTASSTAGGLLQNAFNFEGPNTATDWTSYQNLYDEYRTLGMEIEYVPNMQGTLNTAGLAQSFAPVYSVIDRDTNAVLASYAAAVQYASCKTHTLTQKWKVKMSMEGISSEQNSSINSGEGVWLNCQVTPVLCGAIKVIAVGLSASSTYGHFIVRWRVQFRGRGL